ncbi:MAG TPA: TraR/DksA family transcriptional regulator [Polyangiaceae bacterium]
MATSGATGTSEQSDRAHRAHPDSELTEEQTELLHGMLVDKRKRLVEERQEHLDIGRFTTERIAEAEEAAARDTSQSTMIDLAENERRLLLQIEHALRKMQEGTYGVSDESGEPIGFDRLRAIPWATLSAADQEEVERRTRGRSR